MSKIQWTDETWNPVTGCSKVSPGCKHCYAEKIFPRAYSKDIYVDPGDGDGFQRPRKFTDVWTHEGRLDRPLHWRRPRRVFVNSMSDLFHEDVPEAFIDRVFAIMALCPQHTFQILTKRPERMHQYMLDLEEAGRCQIIGECMLYWAESADDMPDYDRWPLDHIWLGVSVEDQSTADERIPLLLQTPAAVRFVSAEPLLGPINWATLLNRRCVAPSHPFPSSCRKPDHDIRGIDQLIVGGESGPRARPCDIQWIRDSIAACRRVGTAVFVKQIGAQPRNWCAGRLLDDLCDFDDDSCDVWEASEGGACDRCVYLNSRKGDDMTEWPVDLRVREYPDV